VITGAGGRPPAAGRRRRGGAVCGHFPLLGVLAPPWQLASRL
jgi:hypothetical protein